MADRKGAVATRVYVVRMGMAAEAAAEMANVLMRCPEDVRQRGLDQLWLHSVFVEQRRRTNTVERQRFDARADRILEALDPQESSA